MPSYDHPISISPKKVGILLSLALFFIFALAGSCGSVTKVDAGEIVVVQSPIDGTLTWHTSPGLKWRGFGKVTAYRKRDQFWFNNVVNKNQHESDKDDQSITVRFNDGGHADISGSISWEMPLDVEHLNKLHSQYGSHEAIEHQLVRPVVEKAIYMTGPLMSSKESYSERRNDLLQYIEDQINNGVYKTETTAVQQIDLMTGEKRTVNVVKLVQESAGRFARTDDSPLHVFAIKTFNPSINNIVYDETVEKQIQAQQSMTMQVQTAIAEAKRAEQAAITAAKSGEAEAMKAKWEQEVIKARAVTEAQQQAEVAKTQAQKDYDVAQKAAQRQLEVARLDAQAALQYKQAETLRGEGEAARRKAVMVADGALEQRIKAYVEVNHQYADAIKNYQGSWVPTVLMGSTNAGSSSGSGATQLVDLLMAKTSLDLGFRASELGSSVATQAMGKK